MFKNVFFYGKNSQILHASLLLEKPLPLFFRCDSLVFAKHTFATEPSHLRFD